MKYGVIDVGGGLRGKQKRPAYHVLCDMYP